MTTVSRPHASVDWREVLALGEQLAGAPSLADPRDRIVAMTRRLMGGRVSIWLHENLFRLPGSQGGRLFPSQPRLEGMRRAIEKRKVILARRRRRTASSGTWVALPIEDRGLLLGAMQVTRPRGPNFEKEEIELLEALAGVVAVGLSAAQRAEVERFRLGQLNLVHEVSAQIASVLDIDVLSRRVVELIQKTFHYYYVAIFTLQPGAERLRFRASAMKSRARVSRPAPPLEVEVGQGLIGEAAASGQRLVAADVRAEARYRHIRYLPATRSEAVMPLRVEDRILGVLDVQSERVNAFHPNDLLVLEALADNIARAVESARLYSDLRRRAEQLALVAEVSRNVTSTLDLGELMHRVAALIHERLGYAHVHLFTVHPNRRLIVYEAGSGQRSQALKGYALSLDEPQGIIPFVARQGKTVLANDVTQEPLYRPAPLPPRNTRAELCVPLVFAERVLGVLDIQSDKPAAFTEDDRLMFEAVADTIAAAIRNADLYRSEQWRRQVADSLREVAGLLSSNVGVEQVLEAILNELERNLPVDASALWLLDEEGALSLAAVHGLDGQAVEQARLSDPNSAIAFAAALLAETPTIRKPHDPLWPLGLAAGFEADYSSLAAPLRIGKRPLGLISLAHHTPRRYGHEAQAMITTFAGYAAVAIENARLYDSAQEQAYASAALLQAAQAIVSLNDLDEILGTIVRILPILVGVERALLYLWDETRQVFVPAHEYGLHGEARRALWESELKAGEFPLLDEARRQNRLLARPLRAKDAPETWKRLKAPPENPVEAAAERLLIAAPLSIKLDVFGVLLLEEASGARRFRGRRLEIVQGIAQQAALAIQNDRLQQETVKRERLETEVQLARQIQQTFIPESLPQPPNWDLAARWKTARQVGGDFYDVFELPQQRLGLFIADVADKGVPAALFMALTRTLVRAAVLETSSPAEALQRVNTLLLPDTRQGMFVTAVYAVLDPINGTLTYANAGHNPPLWRRLDGSVEKLSRTGIALGVSETEPVGERTLLLAEGEGVLFYTDGLTEAFSAEGDLFGEARLIETIQSVPRTSAEEALEAIESRLTDFVGNAPPADDLTMLMVQRRSRAD